MQHFDTVKFVPEQIDKAKSTSLPMAISRYLCIIYVDGLLNPLSSLNPYHQNEHNAPHLRKVKYKKHTKHLKRYAIQREDRKSRVSIN